MTAVPAMIRPEKIPAEILIRLAETLEEIPVRPAAVLAHPAAVPVRPAAVLAHRAAVPAHPEAVLAHRAVVPVRPAAAQGETRLAVEAPSAIPARLLRAQMEM